MAHKKASAKKKIVKKRKFVVPKPKKFQVFIRKKGKDIFFKSFKSKPKARRELKRDIKQAV